jgi:branched-chain amino acid transport system substrate-binding protein/neutral amino acid transport system substrate-binding protein
MKRSPQTKIPSDQGVSQFFQNSLSWLSRGGAIAALALLAVACQTPTETTETPAEETPEDTAEAPAGGSGEPLRLASLMPLTGDLAQYGGPMADAAALLESTVNACGGVMGQDIEILSADTETNPAAAAAAMTQLAEVDGITGLIGAAASSSSSAAVDIAVRNEVVMISPASTSPVFTERAENGDFNGFWFRTAPPDTFQGDALAELAKEEGFDSVAILSINNDYGNGLVQSFIPAFEALGGTVVNKDNPTLYAPDATTFDSEVTEAFSDTPDAVLLVAYPETGSLILKAAYEQGLLGGDTQMLLTDGMKTDNLAELVGETAEGTFISAGVVGTAPSAAGPAMEAFRELYQAEYNRDPGVFDPNTWDAGAILVLAAEAAQSTAGADIRDQVREVANAPGTPVTDVCEALELVRQGEDIDYQGASGTVDFNDNGDVVGAYDVWTIADDGKLNVKSTINVGG